MNIYSANRTISPLMILAYSLMTVILVLVCIKLIQDAMHMADIYLQVSTRQASQYFTSLIKIY
jgi:TnpA family transposase